jgi:hypothetical protein
VAHRPPSAFGEDAFQAGRTDLGAEVVQHVPADVIVLALFEGAQASCTSTAL